MADADTVAKQFVDFYYSAFDADRKGLAPLYRDVSMMSWEGQQFKGANDIVEKLVSLPFTRVVHKVTTMDAQPSLPGVTAIVITVTGQLQIDDEQKPMQYTQSFQLVDDNGFFVYNDIFRLNYA
ncbi:nuclear transport factor 2 [Linderina pennispora]|uniref:Nuclear transport factor 2 n=1 Tax=Linderina pennispora TaxID=61395 RepID=A0A1Y1WD43_9FUNG|nr:nuclear transport factor 2 [Linderina pennispora]KAJ1949713.1 Nuclear transport factor 2 [Linderina pennispora]ORX71156.1 nuclear transport factor 2 [Linderina pennispora]